MDAVFDRVRMARDKRWHYIRNDFPGLPWAQRQSYMEQQPAWTRARELFAAGEVADWSPVFFAKEKPVEELYDFEKDPHMLVNLARDPAYKAHLERLRSALNELENDIQDLGLVTEEDLIAAGIVENRLDEYRQRVEPLPDNQQIGPYPIPMTMREASRLRDLS